ncbi:11569_t:CDS:2 [Entrophospora sp. SA101]|nr:11569_t:CDS:2 [Entrophospora sp. SA101]
MSGLLNNNVNIIDLPCKFGIHCTNPKCRYTHPSPATTFTSQEPCRYYPNCQNPACPYLHIDYNSEYSNVTTNSGTINKVPTPCRNGAKCTRPGCHFLHPWDMETDATAIPCKFGYNCKRADCMYDHPMGKKLPTHISERTFALPEQMTEKILPIGSGGGDNKDIKDQEKILNRLNNNNGDGKFITSNNNKFSEINPISNYNQSGGRGGGGEQHNSTLQTRTNEGNSNEEEYVFDLDFDADIDQPINIKIIKNHDLSHGFIENPSTHVQIENVVPDPYL